MDQREGHQSSVSNASHPWQSDSDTLSPSPCTPQPSQESQASAAEGHTQQPLRLIVTEIILLNVISIFSQSLSPVHTCLVFLHNCHPNLFTIPYSFKGQEKRGRGKAQSSSFHPSSLTLQSLDSAPNNLKHFSSGKRCVAGSFPKRAANGIPHLVLQTGAHGRNCT